MILVHVNSEKPVAATVMQSPFDDEQVLIPLTPEVQKAWSKRAIPARPRYWKHMPVYHWN
jgi:hypothetical protein